MAYILTCIDDINARWITRTCSTINMSFVDITICRHSLPAFPLLSANSPVQSDKYTLILILIYRDGINRD